jgi:hypothetical protein
VIPDRSNDTRLPTGSGICPDCGRNILDVLTASEGHERFGYIATSCDLCRLTDHLRVPIATSLPRPYDEPWNF